MFEFKEKNSKQDPKKWSKHWTCNYVCNSNIDNCKWLRVIKHTGSSIYVIMWCTKFIVTKGKTNKITTNIESTSIVEKDTTWLDVSICDGDGYSSE